MIGRVRSGCNNYLPAAYMQNPAFGDEAATQLPGRIAVTLGSLASCWQNHMDEESENMYPGDRGKEWLRLLKRISKQQG